MRQIVFLKEVIFEGTRTTSRILIVHGKNYFDDNISSLVIQKFAAERVREELLNFEEKKVDINEIVNYLQYQGYTKISDR